MNTKHNRRWLERTTNALGLLFAGLLVAGGSLLPDETPVQASSHREAPLISQDAFADNTDTYVFISPRDSKNLVLAGSWIPFEGPEGGPNYFEWGNGVVYNLHVDNDGDAVADFTYELTSRVEVRNPNTFLYNVGPITSIEDPNWNRPQWVTIKEIREDGTVKILVDDELTTPVNIGKKSTRNFPSLAQEARFSVKEGNDRIRLFAGQTDDPFWVDLQVFDLLTLRGQDAPIGYSKGNNTPVDSVSGFNVHSFVVEVPIKRLKQGDEPVLGVWATASRPSTRVLNGAGGLGSLTNSGDPVQVSRLGMPLVNEVVIPLALKDAFNSIDPSLDVQIYTDALGEDVGALLQISVEDPEIGRLLCGLYGVPLPGDTNDDCSTEVDVNTPRSGRGDIFDIFLTGMVLANPFTIQTEDGPVTLPAGFNVNRPANVVPAEMIRINTDIKGDLCAPKPSRLGILGGDACGFPNGRRLIDDVVEIELLAVAGAAYEVLDDRDADFTFNPDLIEVLDDNVNRNDVNFRKSFPYMAYAQSGQEHFHENATDEASAASVDSAEMDAADAAAEAEERQREEADEATDEEATNTLYVPLVTN
jgi:hypothetical protein